MTMYERIHYLRKSLLKITQEEIAARISMSRPNFANIEKGKTNLTERVIRDICHAFCVSREWLESGTGPVFTDSKAASNISELYEQLSDNNQKYAKEYIRGLLEEQRSATAALTDSSNFTDEEVELLKAMLERRKRRDS